MRRIAILETGRSAPDIASRFGHFPEFFRRLFGDRAGLAFDDYWIEAGELPSGTGDHDAYIVTGSPHGVYDDLGWIGPLKAFVREAAAARRRVLGVCFGHQLVAEAFGGRVEKSERGWGIGVHRYEVATRHSCMSPPLDAFSLLATHQDQVVEPPPDAVVLAGNTFCPIAMLAVGEDVLSLQPHPEHQRDFAAALYASRIARIGERTVTAALESLATPTDERTVTAWLSNFLEGSSRI